MTDQLDKEIFTCCRCGGAFNHTDGTWLPVGIEEKKEMIARGEYPTVLEFGEFMKPPEVITSKDFTCYDCVETEIKK